LKHPFLLSQFFEFQGLVAHQFLRHRNKTIIELKGQITEKDTIIGQKEARITELEGQLVKLRAQGEETSKAVSQDTASLEDAGKRLDALTTMAP